ncbi:MAG: PEP-utilizing enzyme [bacterium]
MRLFKIFSREYSVQYAEVSIRSLGLDAKVHSPSLVLSQAYIPEQGGNEGCYADKDEWREFISLLEKKYLRKDQLKDFLNEFHRRGKDYINTSQKIGKSKLSEVDNESLAQYYVNYQKDIIVYTTYLWFGFLLNNIYSDKAKEVVNSKKIKDLDSILPSILTPTKLSGILKLQEQLATIKKNQKILNDDVIINLLAKYAWMSCLDIHNDPWTKKEIINFFENLKIPKKLLSFEEIMYALNLSKEELEFINLARELVYVKDMRDVYRRKGVYYAIPLFTEIASRLNIDRKELAYFTQSEIMEALNAVKKLDPKVARKRQGGFLIYSKAEEIRITSDKEEINTFVNLNVLKDNADSVVLKGMPASLGIAKGKVKIVFGIKDLKKVNEGDIIVAITTHPDYVPAMHRASAIITDEGGLTSHAAIVSRELKIPCIVGTKSATSILKDGNTIEIDAERGLIKKL